MSQSNPRPHPAIVHFKSREHDMLASNMHQGHYPDHLHRYQERDPRVPQRYSEYNDIPFSQQPHRGQNPLPEDAAPSASNDARQNPVPGDDADPPASYSAIRTFSPQAALPAEQVKAEHDAANPYRMVVD